MPFIVNYKENGMLNVSEFNDSAKEFYEKSKLLNELWKLFEEQSVVYLHRTWLVVNRDLMIRKHDIECNDPYTIYDDCMSSDLKNINCYVIYSFSFCVPCLYFNASNASGTFLPLEKITTNSELVKWKISQQEHPIINRPFYVVHPCDTSELMKKILNCNKNVNYIASWLSIVGPLIGLFVSEDYFT